MLITFPQPVPPPKNLQCDSAHLSEAPILGWAELPSGDADLAPRTLVDS